MNVPVVGQPFRKIAIDIVGPLPGAPQGNKYILTLVDYARYLEAITIPHMEIVNIADELFAIFSRIGILEELLSDQ